GAPTPPGWVSLPAVGDEFLRQLTAEALVRKVVRGVERLEWIKVYNRNEALDGAIYSRAAAHMVGLDRFTEADWRRLEAPFGSAPSPAQCDVLAPDATASPVVPQAPSPVRTVVPVPGTTPPNIRWRRSTYWQSRGPFWR